MSYLQRNNKIPYTAIDPNSWFIRENLCDKISIDVPWSLIEPQEGNYDWRHREWEGCFQSWVDAGYKVLLRVRGMDTLGTLYDQGTPQWVFDAGAKYIDDPISIYRREKVLLNNIPADGELPIRYPVYWDPVYIEKAERFINELGRRYNQHPAVESVSISFVGRWGEMHIGDWGPMEPWIDAGFSIKVYNQTLIRFIDIYRNAFPDKMLSLSIGRPALYSEYTYNDVMEVIDYAVSCGVMLKYDGLGCSFEPDSTAYLCRTVSKIFEKYRYRTKLAFENLVLPAALDEGIEHGISYWNRGGEIEGLAIMRLSEDIPVFDKRIFSWYNKFSEQYNALSQEAQKDCFRKMARKCGYRLMLDSVVFPESIVAGKTQGVIFSWRNVGHSPCFEKFHIELGLFDNKSGNYVWRQEMVSPSSGNPKVWDAGKSIREEIQFTFPQELSLQQYELRLGVKLDAYNHEMMQLALMNKGDDNMYYIGKVQIRCR